MKSKVFISLLLGMSLLISGRALAVKLKKSATSARIVVYSRILLPAEVEKITGLKKLKTIVRGSKAGAGGAVNLADDKGRLVLILNGQALDPKEYNQHIAQGDMKGLYSGTVKGIGEAAWEGPAQGTKYLLAIYTGGQWVTISTFLDPAITKPFITMEQLKKIGRLVVSKLRAK